MIITRLIMSLYIPYAVTSNRRNAREIKKEDALDKFMHIDERDLQLNIVVVPDCNMYM